MSCKYSILITSKNRLTDLIFTLNKINYLIERTDVECLLYDDASTDGTYNYVKENFPKIILLRNENSLGLIHNRNVLLNNCSGEYAISLDDDAHFESENVLEIIENHFKTNSKCGVIACRIFWGLKLPNTSILNEEIIRTKAFVGCGHIWNIKAWREIANYPEWFVFYGEEEFAAFQLFKKAWEIQYVPQILVHHRVDIKSRKQKSDYQIRLRRSLRSGWYLYFLFYPWNQIPKRFSYTLWIQIKKKVLKGDVKATFAILQALGDVIIHFPKLMKISNRLNKSEFDSFNKFEETKIYWNP
ncbi:glycosyltransferase [Flavobacterium sp. ST-87]|uniref:Glycosyltransferase n=1 Tax=Flavobacterium plantiphilum TaxID=3163297 RepID=A0ABW8XWD2_9FLAO